MNVTKLNWLISLMLCGGMVMAGCDFVQPRDTIDKVIAEYTLMLVENPDDATTYVNRGIRYYVKGDFDAAIADYTRAIELDPESAVAAMAHNNRGVVYRFGLRDDPEGLGIKDYNRAI